MTDLIVNFPRHRDGDNHRSCQAVQFADTAQLHIFKPHQDSEKNYVYVAPHELWYTRSEHYSMRRAAVEDALQVRARILSGAPLNYSGNAEAGAPVPADEGLAEEERSSVCCIGIEHLLTPAIVRQRRARIDRCIDAVLTEQERRGSSEMDIALASFVHSRGAALRARRLGRLHQDSI
jgi:hypothetical protein